MWVYYNTPGTFAYRDYLDQHGDQGTSLWNIGINHPYHDINNG